MFIGDQYPYARTWGLCPLHLLHPLQSSLSNSEDRPCSRGRDMECRSGSPGPPPWAPGGGLRGLKSQFSARVGDSHSLTHALVFLPPWSLPQVFCAVPTPSPRPCFHHPPLSPSLHPSHQGYGYPIHSWAILFLSSPSTLFHPSIHFPHIVPDNIWGPLRKGFLPL